MNTDEENGSNKKVMLGGGRSEYRLQPGGGLRQRKTRLKPVL